MIQMWHNPSCSKCAAANDTLTGQGIALTLRPYLTDRPSAAELADILARLGMQPWELCRTGEAAAAELAGWTRTEADRERWIAALVAHPELIQRPILLLPDGTAMIARTPEALAEAVRRSRDG